MTSLVWPAIRTYAVTTGDGQVAHCEPFAGPVKVVYATEWDAQCAARALAELGQGQSTAYACPRHRGARRREHFHLTSRVGDVAGAET